MPKCALFWSGGKDAAMALHRLQQSPDFEPSLLVCTLSIPYRRIAMHGIAEELLEAQAKAIGLPLLKMWLPADTSNESYEQAFNTSLKEIKAKGIEHVAFGDILLEDLKNYREKLLAKQQVQGVYPLWKIPTQQLAEECIDQGFQAAICCAQELPNKQRLDGHFFDHQFLANLPQGVDPCGENGEFHTYCFAGPHMLQAVSIKKGESLTKTLPLGGGKTLKVHYTDWELA